MKQSSRRAFLKQAAMSSGVAVSGLAAEPQSSPGAIAPKARPNILMICADQFRADFIGANHANPGTRTPHLDALAARGTNFRRAVCNQPLCTPSRASFLTSHTATEAGCWKLGQELDHALPTVASALKAQGYTTAFMGKWHVALAHAGGDPARNTGTASPQGSQGLVPAGPARGGFDDVFEGANVLEVVSHPTEGNYWDTAGNNIGFHDIYRVDFITNRAVSFLEQTHTKPWLLFVSQLEPHHQNDTGYMVPPERYAGSFNDPFIPHDLRALPGNWQTHLPGYYGCVQAIDDSIGKLMATLEQTKQLDNTVVVFFSDHGCTFRTRLGEYKRSPHESSLRVPLLFAGPGFDNGSIIDELVTLLDLTPTLIAAGGAPIPPAMRGKPLQPLVVSPAARKQWVSSAYIQISSSICGRAIRTSDWVYCCYDPTIPGGNAAGSQHYTDFALYSLAGDPYQQVNLVGREEYRGICNDLRVALKQLIIQHGEPEPVITPMLFYA